MNRSKELENCRICPRDCYVNRFEELGYCGASSELKINLYQLHYGEEPAISGIRGSGTVFLSHCNLKCVFCQNHEISCDGWGRVEDIQRSAEILLELQSLGAHNVNLVTPSHYSIQLAEVIRRAQEQGLSIPVVWNSNAYEHVETLEKLDGLVDIYLPDMKFSHGVYAGKYSHTIDYPTISRLAVKEMHKQVGNLQVDHEGAARKGLIIRLLVMPRGVSGTKDTLQWISDEIGTDVHLSVMAQYYPTYQASRFEEIARGINRDEYDTVVAKVQALGFRNVYLQELSADSEWTPIFNQE
ncbi:MAG: radical SAM protein [Candidatus Cloacimonetes bacterium HGW-Cloacimonetes-1]|jgi:putative pyruvate formate lyase activating enzyme|nr:MAG: radical SAM protein [Candidatus Cloacimonetes bacterium HGW-Cloacimonetes-1]